MRPDAVLLVLAKAPVPGRVKTRLCPPATPEQAAAIAAAALADTLDATAAVPGATTVVALAGTPRGLGGVPVLPQRDDGLGARIAAAHADVADRLPGRPTLQLGMDTPQVHPDLPELTDVDTMADARAVAAGLPGSRFAAAVAEVGG